MRCQCLLLIQKEGDKDIGGRDPAIHHRMEDDGASYESRVGGERGRSLYTIHFVDLLGPWRKRNG